MSQGEEGGLVPAGLIGIQPERGQVLLPHLREFPPVAISKT